MDTIPFAAEKLRSCVRPRLRNLKGAIAGLAAHRRAGVTTRAKDLAAGEPVSRILCVASVPELPGSGDVAIIPLGPGSLRDSSSLPEGRIAAPCGAANSGWASPPLLFGLAPRGVFRAPVVATRAVGSYPTFSPLPARFAETGEPSVSPKVCRRGASIAGGLSFCGTFRSRPSRRAFARLEALPPGVTRRVALRRSLLRVRGDGVGLSSRPLARTGDHPAHPACRIIRRPFATIPTPRVPRPPIIPRCKSRTSPPWTGGLIPAAFAKLMASKFCFKNQDIALGP